MGDAETRVLQLAVRIPGVRVGFAGRTLGLRHGHVSVCAFRLRQKGFLVAATYASTVPSSLTPTHRGVRQAHLLALLPRFQ